MTRSRSFVCTGARLRPQLSRSLEDLADRRRRGSREKIFEEESHLHFQEERAAYMDTLNSWFEEIETASAS